MLVYLYFKAGRIKMYPPCGETNLMWLEKTETFADKRQSTRKWRERERKRFSRRKWFLPKPEPRGSQTH